ncbi:patatin-like phospholipase family protein [Curtobacterium pusillum]|uniref:Patatin-like phospholipase family protein n=1 Tax=Curtobacterium pusillum TaxID=69373 RepID=A0ABX2M8G2_9MICO|nr:patatin-like phospholipase family protein [Curtobacterium pusillum]NUU13190.1 patatin-like phospholipase family protein [Curtobacterium pusillum]GLK31786.1 patatin [Curtobacterium pusillum]
MHSPSKGRRALVLGGGGSTGNAWLIGVVAGLFDAGLDVTGADLTIGTSAGSTAAVQFAGAPPAELYAQAVGTPPGAPRRTPPNRPVTSHLDRFRAIIAASTDAADMRRRMGAAALELEAASDGSWPAQWRSTVATRLPVPSWPERTVAITAVDASTGEPIVFDRTSGVDVVDAVAASCSSSLPFPIGDARYIDGGYRRNENADLAAGYERVLVLSPFGGRTMHPASWGMQLSAQVDELRAGGSSVETVFPTAADEHVFGADAMNPSLRPEAARAGHRLGTALAGPLGAFWR